jgi:hypothetical protein
MQLTGRKLGRIAAGLSALTANLLSANPVLAQDAAQPLLPGLMDEGAPEPGSLVFDSSVLFYQESGGRVRAIEPVINVLGNLSDGSMITGGLTYDTLTGATPNGAMPWTSSQTFNSIVKVHTSSQVTTTSSSGGAVVTTIPGTAYAHSTYSTPAGAIPLASFHDHRIAANLGYSWLPDPDTRLKLGGAFSVEKDYTTFSGELGISHDFNQKNTTLALTLNAESDISRPYSGTPAPFEEFNSQIAAGNDSKSVLSAVVGVTQTVTRFWLTQLTYDFSTSHGYQSDPYRVLSVVDSATGAPVDYLYENRPRSRQRQSVYWGNKLALGPTVADLSLRYYHDNWGINSLTAEVSEQVPITRYLYVKPLFRYYHQSAANFFRYYLVNGDALPQFASSDSRLGRFNATTIGGRVGWRLLEDSELYVEAESYRQTGAHYDPAAPGALAGLDLFSGVHALSVMAGFKIKI